MSNLRQIGTALQAYIGDNEENLPGPAWVNVPHTFTPDPSFQPTIGYLMDYLDPVPAGEGEEIRIEMAVCPTVEARFGDEAPTHYRRVLSLLGTQDLLGRDPRGQADRTGPMKYGHLESGGHFGLTPSQIPYIFDFDEKIPPGGGNYPVPSGPVHNDGRNYLFFTGHVEHVKGEEFPFGPYLR